MGVITRSILNGMLLAFLVTAALLTVSGYAFLTIGAEGVRQAQNSTRDRGVEITHALATMAGEKFDRDMAVKMSAVMYQIVRQSDQKSSNYIVDELLLLTATNELMAHNDVALLAEGARSPDDYSDEKYTKALNGSVQLPTRVNSIDEKDFAGVPFYGLVGALIAGADESIGRAFPEKITTRTHISTAVFPVDQELPSGSVHMFVTHTSTNDFVAALRKVSIDTLIMTAAFVFLITFIMILLMTLSFREEDDRPRRARRPDTGRRRSAGGGRKSIVLETPEGESDEGIAPPVRETVLDPKPANRARRRSPLPGPAGGPGILDEERPLRAVPAAAAVPDAQAAGGPPTVEAAYVEEDYEDESEEFIDDYEDDATVAAPQARPAAPAPTPRRASRPAEEFNPYAAVAGDPLPHRPGPRIMDAIPLDQFSKNKSARGPKRTRS
ncbi:MAG: hypothetical protein NXI24_12465 [bacterium]|nr:hypothetical protein [bacterium]